MRYRISTCLAGVVVASAAFLGKSDGQNRVHGLVQTESAPPRPVEGFQFDQLPVGKTIGIRPAEVRISEILKQPAEFDLVDTTLEAFAAEIAAKYKITVLFDTAALTADGKGTDTILNGKIGNTTLRAAILYFLEQQGLTFSIRYESFMITTATAAETHTSIRLYQVHDLTLHPNDPAARPDFERLIELITSTIEPHVWREAGGTIGEIRSYEGPGISVLVVDQTDEGHEQVEKLLADLRAAKIEKLLELQQKRERSVYRPTIPSGMSGASS